MEAPPSAAIDGLRDCTMAKGLGRGGVLTIVTAFNGRKMVGLSKADSLGSTSKVADGSDKLTEESDGGDSKLEHTGRCFFTNVTLVSSSLKTAKTFTEIRLNPVTN